MFVLQYIHNKWQSFTYVKLFLTESFAFGFSGGKNKSLGITELGSTLWRKAFASKYQVFKATLLTQVLLAESSPTKIPFHNEMFSWERASISDWSID